MSIGYILSQSGNKMGLNPKSTNDRSILLRFLNEAARELYVQSDMVGSQMEQVFKVNGDQTIALPSYVGHIRAIREYNSKIPWSINQMRPRYNQFNWTDMYRNVRLKNRQALMSSITNQGPVQILPVPNGVDGLVVTVTGSTPTATSISEDITTGDFTKNDFLDIFAVKKNEVTDYDVSLLDVDGKILTVIPNNELSALYQIIDVSSCPWLNQTSSALDHYVEILYKQSLPIFLNDGDEFPASGFDDVIVNKILQLWSEEKGNTELAQAYDQKATRSLARIHEDANRATQDEVALCAHPHDGLLAKVRARRPGRYGGYSGMSRFGGF